MPALLIIIAVALVVALVLEVWKVLVGVVVIALVGVVAWLAFSSWRLRRRKRATIERGRASRLAMRAQTQHEQYLAGEDRGVYGEYRPADLG